MFLSRRTQLAWVLGLCFVVHWAVGAAVGLTVDEAHYLLYASYLDWSYFDHPPLVGWIQWPLVAASAPDFVLRLLPGLVWLTTMLVVYRITLRLQPDAATPAAARWAVGVLCAAPLMHLLGIGLLPDTLLMLWAACLMLHTLRMMDLACAPTWWDWTWMGVLLGLAGLSKYTAILPALAAAACLLRVQGAGLLRQLGFWWACLLAALLVLPVFTWNAQHDWISFVYQLQHGKGGVWQGMSVLQFVLLQIVSYGPLLLVSALGWWRAKPEHRLLGGFFVVPFVVHAWMSGGGSSLPHWTAPAWVAAAPFAGLALADLLQKRVARWLVGALLALQVLACAVLLGWMLSGGRPGFTGAAENAVQPNPFADVHGWKEVGARSQELASQHQLPALAVQNWTLASRLAWYARPLPVQVLDTRFDQFDLWFGAIPEGGRALLVDWSQMPYIVPQAPNGFTQCRWLETLPVVRWGQALGEFRFYACTGWTGTPQPVQAK